VPHFGSSQPGETYYYTPLTVYAFGVVDCADEDHCYVHMYPEGDGAKGGNNVASLLMKTLRKLDLLKVDEDGKPLKGKELNIIFDNCPGQNKNNYVLWLVPYLVERGYFDKVNFIFLIVGHTKNACDRRFNNMKKVYNKCNVYSVDHSIEICNQSEHVTCWRVEEGDFVDYKEWFSKYYQELAKGGVKLTENHIFSCETENGEVYTKTGKKKQLFVRVRKSDVETHPIIKAGIITRSKLAAPAFENRVQDMKNTPKTALPLPGIPDYKMMQLYKNYRELLPEEYRDVTCPKPSDAIFISEKEDQKLRRTAKKQKKEEKKDAAASRNNIQ
jgi:hypothetical protein